MSTIAITFALPAESSDFRARLTGLKSNRKSHVFEGRIHGQRVAIHHTGVGNRVAASRVSTFLERYDLHCLISAGFAGALDPALSVGDIVLARNFSDPDLIDLAHRAIGDRAFLGDVAHTSRVVESAPDRRQLAERTSAMAMDMETESIAELCAARNLPMLSLRAISDTAVAPFPAPAEVLFDIDIQRTPYLLLARHLLLHPGVVGRLIQFSRQVARARASLANALSAFLQKLPP